MADLLIRGASEYDTIGVTHRKAFNAMSGEDYELVVLPTHGRLVDWDEVERCIEETVDCDIKQYALSLISWAAEKRVVIEASEDGEQDG